MLYLDFWTKFKSLTQCYAAKPLLLHLCDTSHCFLSNIGFFWPQAKLFFPLRNPKKPCMLSPIFDLYMICNMSHIFPPFQTLDSRCSTWLHIKVDYQLEPNIIHLFPEKHNHQDLFLYHNIERPQTYRLDNAWANNPFSLSRPQGTSIIIYSVFQNDSCDTLESLLERNNYKLSFTISDL